MSTLPNAGDLYAHDVELLESKCEVCALGKSIPQFCPAHELVAARLVNRVYPDAVGPLKSLSLGMARYLMTLLDEYRGFFVV